MNREIMLILSSHTGENTYVSVLTRAARLPISSSNETVVFNSSNFLRHLPILHSQFARAWSASALKLILDSIESKLFTVQPSARTPCCNVAAHASR